MLESGGQPHDPFAKPCEIRVHKPASNRTGGAYANAEQWSDQWVANTEHGAPRRRGEEVGADHPERDRVLPHGPVMEYALTAGLCRQLWYRLDGRMEQSEHDSKHRVKTTPVTKGNYLKKQIRITVAGRKGLQPRGTASETAEHAAGDAGGPAAGDAEGVDAAATERPDKKGPVAAGDPDVANNDGWSKSAVAAATFTPGASMHKAVAAPIFTPGAGVHSTFVPGAGAHSAPALFPAASPFVPSMSTSTSTSTSATNGGSGSLPRAGTAAAADAAWRSVGDVSNAGASGEGTEASNDSGRASTADTNALFFAASTAAAASGRSDVALEHQPGNLGVLGEEYAVLWLQRQTWVDPRTVRWLNETTEVGGEDIEC